MSVARVMGTETEYAVSVQGGGRYNPVELSFDVVAAASDPATRHIRWDYRGEDPLRDAFGHRVERVSARPDMLTDAPQLGIVNVIAENGGRVYVDHAHPEYSSPETTDPFEAVRYDHAGDLLMAEAARKASRGKGETIELHRNNVDGKGSSWGSHENYMMLRSVPFGMVAALMTAHFVSRQIYTGSGRVGLGEHGEHAGYQLSQRADYIHAITGLQTTFDRPIVNTRDESHGTGANRRLHVIVGDANQMDVPQALKLGTTSMLLWLLERGSEGGFDIAGLLRALKLADPVAAMHVVSHDLSLSAELPLEDGSNITAWQMQVLLMSAVFEVAAAAYGTDSGGEPVWPDTPTKRTMLMWKKTLNDIAKVRHAGEGERLVMREEAGRIEWLLKWQLLERFRQKNGCSWQDKRLYAIDLRWAALDPQTSVFALIRPQCEALMDATALAQAKSQAPANTRAWLRAELIRRYPSRIRAVSWTQMTATDLLAPRGAVTLDMPDPLRFNAAGCSSLLDQAHTERWSMARLFERLNSVATS